MDAPAAALSVIEVGGDRSRMEQAWMLRRRVFIKEQHVPETIELDADDAHAFHALALEDGRPVGCGRMLVHNDYVKIGRMAVLAANAVPLSATNRATYATALPRT